MPPPGSTLFPYTTLFRSVVERGHRVLMRLRMPRRRIDHRLSSPAERSECRGSTVLQNSSSCELMGGFPALARDRKSTRLNSSHQIISYAVFCLKKKKLRQ